MSQGLLATIVDEIAINKHVSWDSKRYRCYGDLGNGVEDDDSSPVAKDTLVLMAVSVNGAWKIPCSYFFVDELSELERANLFKVCIQRLHGAGCQSHCCFCDM